MQCHWNVNKKLNLTPITADSHKYCDKESFSSVAFILQFPKHRFVHKVINHIRRFVNFTFMNNYRGPQIDTRSVVFNLIAINVFVYFACFFCKGLFPYNSPALFFGLHYPSSEFFKPFQIITHLFMHEPFNPANPGSLGHIFFNMFGLYMFGTVLERVWGPRRFLEFYFLTGFGGVLLFMLVQAAQIYYMTGSFAPPLYLVDQNKYLYLLVNETSIGASGAVFGLLTAYGILFANTELYIFAAIPVKAKYLVAAMIAYELFRGAQNSDNIGHFAHLGGALIAYIVVKIWSKDRKNFY